MKTRQLGRHGPRVSAIGLGCMSISQSYGVPNEVEGIATIHRALELGVNFFDTADVYGPFTNETLVGRAIQGRKETIILASKCGLVAPDQGGPNRVDGTPDHIRAACDASLARLNVPCIDLYYLHRVDPRTPIEESVGAMAELVEEGKVRFLGLSEVHPNTLRRAHKVHPIAAVQSEYSLWTRDPEQGVLATCRDLGIAFVPFSPLGRGFLSGTVRSLEGLPPTDFRRGLPRFQDENLARNLALVDRLTQLAHERGCTPAQFALAWVLSRGPDVIPIPGTKHPAYVEENVAAVDLELTRSDLARMEEEFQTGMVAGDRYSPTGRALIDRG
ncbi:MAG: aldo/keto reductase [Thermoplasmata archaeon]|jgi:aryl-alcohol dehydrogenase-like predicted oxidoreductase|nr:aldo/keto reductase [Thermoplasmata archaeon]